MAKLVSVGGIPVELMPRDGERTGADGYAIRSNKAWRELAADAIKARNAARQVKAELAVDAKHWRESCEALESEIEKHKEYEQGLETALRECQDKVARLQELNDVQARTIGHASTKAQCQLAAIRTELAGLTLGQIEGLGVGYAGALLAAYMESSK